MSQFRSKRNLEEEEVPKPKRQRRSKNSKAPVGPKIDDHSEVEMETETESDDLSDSVKAPKCPPSSFGTVTRITSPVDFALDYTIDDEWVSATTTKNFLLKDPVEDFFKRYHTSIARNNPKVSGTILKAVQAHTPIEESPDTLANFSEFLMHQGKKFEKGVYNMLYHLFRSDVEIVDLGGDTAPRSTKKFAETIDAMKKGIPIIINAVLHDPETKTFGIADLIVRSDYLRRIVDSSPVTKKEEKIGAPLFEGKNYHYRVIDVKFSTLYLRSDGIHLCNPGSIPAFKGQVYIYNRIVAKIQGYDPCVAYILGRRWKYTKSQQVYSHPACNNRLGVVDFAGVDYPYVAKVQQAIDWIRDMRTNGEEWDIFTSPLPRPELYPNMKYRNDHPWHEVKELQTDVIKDITRIWMCGPKQRAFAHAQGIYEWTDPRCTAETLGITGEKRARIVNAMLKINREPEGPNVQPVIVKNNLHSWKNEKDLEFFVDFESGPDVCPDFSKLPDGSSHASLTMIGVGYICPDLNVWVYQDFTVNRMSREEEKRICEEFSKYITTTKQMYSAKTIALYHWSNAEPQMWNSASERHGALLDNFWYDIAEDWADLFEVFRDGDEPIVIRGCFSFGLKEVAKALHHHGLIKTTWDHENPCSNGPAAMVMAHRASEEAGRREVSMRDLPLLKQIREYNEIDCKVMADILLYLRKHHISKKKVRR